MSFIKYENIPIFRFPLTHLWLEDVVSFNQSLMLYGTESQPNPEIFDIRILTLTFFFFFLLFGK